MTQPLHRPSLVEAICERLLNDHRGTTWLPPERKLALDLGVSRPALREAIKRLENQGLLAARHGVGVEIVDEPHVPIQGVLERALPAPAERIRQFTAARLIVEPPLARLAATRAKRDDRSAWQAAHRRLLDSADLAAAVEADLEFHRAIARAAGNQVLALMLASMSRLEAESRHVTLGRVGLEEARAQHQSILDALLARDADAAESAMRHHLDAAEAALLRNRRA